MQYDNEVQAQYILYLSLDGGKCSAAGNKEQQGGSLSQLQYGDDWLEVPPFWQSDPHAGIVNLTPFHLIQDNIKSCQNTHHISLTYIWHVSHIYIWEICRIYVAEMWSVFWQYFILSCMRWKGVKFIMPVCGSDCQKGLHHHSIYC